MREKKMKVTKSQLRQIIKEELENISEMGVKASKEEPEAFYGHPPESALDKVSAEENENFYKTVRKLVLLGHPEEEALEIAQRM